MSEYLKDNLKEISLLLQHQQEAVSLLSKLIESNSLKYVTRPERDILLRDLLERQDTIDDGLKSTIKQIRNIRRVRIRDDSAISLLAQYISTVGGDMDKIINIAGLELESLKDDLT